MGTDATFNETQVSIQIEPNSPERLEQELLRRKKYLNLFGGIAIVLLILGLALEKFNNPAFGNCSTSSLKRGELPCNSMLEITGRILCVTSLVMQVLFPCAICFYFPQNGIRI